ncbi:uncharacterized protein LOC120089281 [Benincasa hispida]|uniref:uncharacterized protein LOC120089281 n=1 Tax=Benincasa hispida TaxID=102211 RepID=UPI0019010DA0|nr:uncharacterized protein LOC120089281 [Benincasa hispida]
MRTGGLRSLLPACESSSVVAGSSLTVILHCQLTEPPSIGCIASSGSRLSLETQIWLFESSWRNLCCCSAWLEFIYGFNWSFPYPSVSWCAIFGHNIEVRERTKRRMTRRICDRAMGLNIVSAYVFLMISNFSLEVNF